MSQPRGMAANPDGSQLFITEHGAGQVAVFDTTSGDRTATISVGDAPIDVGVTPNGLFAYVTNFGSGDVSVIDTTNNSVISTIPVEMNPRGLDISPDGLKTYVSNYGSNSITVIDNGSNTVANTINLERIAGRTYGRITDAGEQSITVSNEVPEPDGGVRITTAAGTGLDPASIDVCEWPFTLTIGAGSDIVFSCPGSVAVEVSAGSAELSFTTWDGMPTSVALESGYAVQVESPEFVTDSPTLQTNANQDNPGPIVLNMAGKKIVLQPGDESAHSDGDGIADDIDVCPLSDLSETVIIDRCDSGVSNPLAANGCTISDRAAMCADNAKDQRSFLKCLGREVNVYKKAGVISGQGKGTIMGCARGAGIR